MAVHSKSEEPRLQAVLSFVDEAVASAPDALAVSGLDERLTYAELSARAEELTSRLWAAGVVSGDFVGVSIDRSPALAVAALAVMRAGAAYVAIDPAYPDERVRQMLEDSGAVAVLTAPPEGGETALRTLEPTQRHDAGDDLAYVVYTSGSTGRPKGVAVEHASLANLIDWHRSTFALEAGDRCAQIASPGFDASVWELWPALAAGASLHVVPSELRGDPAGLRDWLVAERVTHAFVPTAVADTIIGLPWPPETALKVLLTGGDALTRRPPAGLGFTVVNNYGLSETTVVATSGTVSPDGTGAPSIGRAITGVVTEVLDEQLQPVAPGEPGELVVGGVAVAPGYLGRPELTAERFLDGPAGRRYRTGDRVRMSADGEIEFLGRTDDQLSIRGVRVEPGEVAGTLAAHPGIAAGVAVGVGETSAESQLIAYVVAESGVQPTVPELRSFLAQTLPEAMIPSRFVWLDALPLTPHGKVDRAALPAPDADEREPAGSGREASTPIEAEVAAIVAELLEVSEVGMDENFFLLGGHSMLGAQLIGRIAESFDAEIGLRYLFDHPTPALIAEEIERQRAADGAVSR